MKHYKTVFYRLMSGISCISDSSFNRSNKILLDYLSPSIAKLNKILVSVVLSVN